MLTLFIYCHKHIKYREAVVESVIAGRFQQGSFNMYKTLKLNLTHKQVQKLKLLALMGFLQQ